MSSAVKGKIEDMQIMLHKPGSYTKSTMHSHDAYEIFILEEAERSYMLEDKLIHLRPRDVLLIDKNKSHYAFGGNSVGTLLEFPSTYLTSFFSESAISLIMECFTKSVIRVRQSEFGSLLTLVEKLYENKNDFLAFGQMLTVLKNNMSRKTYDLQSPKLRSSDIVDYITENYMIIDNLGDVANRFYISTEYLCRVFKNRTGTSIIKYINVLKIYTSLELMSNNNLTFTEIAKKSGYKTLANFSKTFKIVTGVSPYQYRKSLKNSDK